MEKIQEFYLRLIKDNDAKKELKEILKGKEFLDATDDQLLQIGKIAERMGYSFTLEEVHSFLKSGDDKLSDSELESVAGGRVKEVHMHYVRCEIGGSAESGK